MMIDTNIVAVSPSSVRNVLKAEGLLDRWNRKPSSKGTGFKQPSKPHSHWHTDVTYINLGGTFYCLASVLEGYSGYMIHWELKSSMKEEDIELIIQRARERFPGVKPRIISDNGPQFVARDFKEFIRLAGMTHVRTSPYYPQSNGKIESWHKSLKLECIRPRCPSNLSEATKVIKDFVLDYNCNRLHSSIGYITPSDKLQGREEEIFSMRDQRLEQARERRGVSREMLRSRDSAPQIERHLYLPAGIESMGSRAVNVATDGAY